MRTVTFVSWPRHIRSVDMKICRWGRSLLSRITYGYDPAPKNDRYVWLAKELEQLIADVARPGAYLVDTFPFCTHSVSGLSPSTFSDSVVF